LLFTTARTTHATNQTRAGSVNIWEFELVPDEHNEGLSKRLSCAHLKSLKMTDDVLCVKYSPDQRFLAVALLDATVKVFFADSLKFFLSL